MADVAPVGDGVVPFEGAHTHMLSAMCLRARCWYAVARYVRIMSQNVLARFRRLGLGRRSPRPDDGDGVRTCAARRCRSLAGFFGIQAPRALLSCVPVRDCRRPDLEIGCSAGISYGLVSRCHFDHLIPDAFESMLQVPMGRPAPSSAETGKLVRRPRTRLRRFEVHHATLACFCDDCAEV